MNEAQTGTWVVLPTYNEIENLPLIAPAILEKLPEATLLVVDDSSPDGTGDLANRMALENPRVKVLHRAAKQGLGKAYTDGFRHALDSGAEVLIQMDADWSHDPGYLPGMVAALQNGADLVIGSRYVTGVSVVNWPLHRIILSSFANQYIRAITGLAINDCTSGYRCWRREALARIPLEGLISDGYAFLVEQLHLARQSGCRIREVPIIFVERRQGASKVSSRVLIESAIVPWRLRLKSYLTAR